MRRRGIGTVAVVVALALMVTGPGAVAVASPARPYGASVGTWAGRWWQWIFSMPLDENHPFNDSTGVNCGNGQSTNQMWFLAGVNNTSGEPTRGCEVPPGRMILFPVLNIECSTLEAPPFYGKDAAELKACAESFKMEDMYATLDGMDVPMKMVTSGVFDFTVQEGWEDGNYFAPGTKVGDEGQSVAHGAHVLLPPLPPGSHLLEFGGYFPDFDFQLDITYQLTVG